MDFSKVEISKIEKLLSELSDEELYDFFKEVYQLIKKRLKGRSRKIELEPDEQQYLVNFYGKVGLKELASHFNVSQTTITNWAISLNLRPHKAVKEVSAGFFEHDTNLATI